MASAVAAPGRRDRNEGRAVVPTNMFWETAYTQVSTKAPPPRLASDLLRKAWARIDTPNKWIKGKDNGYGPDGCVAHCSRGALFAEAAATGTFMEAVAYLGAAVASRYPGVGGGSPDVYIHFNDSPVVTHAMLREAWETAIAAAEFDEAASGRVEPPKPLLLSDILAAEMLPEAAEAEDEDVTTPASPAVLATA